MNRHLLYKPLTNFIGLVWLVNGLFCKVLNLVPRHQLIVAQILGKPFSGIITKIIGILEILMVIWVISNIKSRYCAIVQIVVVATMNIIEFFVVPDFLLFGRLNAVFAAIFIGIVYYNEFMLRPHTTP